MGEGKPKRARYRRRRKKTTLAGRLLTASRVPVVFLQLRRKLNDVGIGLSPDLEDLLEKVQPVLAGG